MFLYNHNQMAAEAQTKQAQMLEEAEQQRLAVIVQSGKRHFKLLPWLLSILRRRPVSLQTKRTHSRKVNRKPVSNQGW
jgi:hypothetical protein